MSDTLIIQFKEWWWVYYLVPLVFFSFIIRRYSVKKPVFRYSLSDNLGKEKRLSCSPFPCYILNGLRISSLIGLAFLIAQPQLVDVNSSIKTQGIDIILSLDISGSMEIPDFDGNRMRIDIAKQEAVRFINKRDNDAIGLVIFAQDAISRVPLTLDKQLLSNVVKELKIGLINPDGTKLITSILAAANRLKSSRAKTKIIIVLTDGEPSPDDLQPVIALEVAKKYGIKIYTIGIGPSEPQLFRDIWGRVMQVSVNKELLRELAEQTGGKFFMASDAQAMRTIYNTIDTLEKTELESPLFTRYYDIFPSWLRIIIIMLLSELLLATFLWFGV